MIHLTKFSVPKSLFELAQTQVPVIDYKLTLNTPTGDFFYDPWVIRDEFKDSVWHNVLDTLPTDIGEARIIRLPSGKCYQSHADIDDRYHLSIQAEYAFIINLDNNEMFPIYADRMWYDFNAGSRHTATNFGELDRIQLVVRKLLPRNELKDPVHAIITTTITNADHARYKFDDLISPWLNHAHKKKMIANFVYSTDKVKFDLEKEYVDSLISTIPKNFNLGIEQ